MDDASTPGVVVEECVRSGARAMSGGRLGGVMHVRPACWMRHASEWPPPKRNTFSSFGQENKQFGRDDDQ